MSSINVSTCTLCLTWLLVKRTKDYSSVSSFYPCGYSSLAEAKARASTTLFFLLVAIVFVCTFTALGSLLGLLFLGSFCLGDGL
jgi:hypothetical protein